MERVRYIRSMSPEIVTMLGVGVAIVAFLWRTMTSMEQRLDKRIDRLESKVDGLAKDHGSLAGELAELRASFAGELAELRGSFAGELAEIRERMARLEGLFGDSSAGIRPPKPPWRNKPYSAASIRPREVSRSTSSR